MRQLDFAKSLRRNMTDAEQLLWKQLRAHRLNGEKFRRQQIIGPYIVDFVHFGARLIIEADGGQHHESRSDAARDAWLQTQGFSIMRFWNHDILRNRDTVLETIWQALNARAK
ncbi:very-short-patch-repair endonuclease [Chromobacterium alkanivorans]|uniref:endonuclease domain-containing protein n=1 Tax=Chromobacterium alkanivorans TaxID=1071719 RepID=UPI0021686386|nr:endonuclease domain-containing protein [Chromobacterium alkanivorans]MCS3806456.1 very-short-patch-repair endonuclease [Chromobacterium alkanivorans]MCS3875771.1 very-short-patch-repair endonuclease [Chromobacterium alkanivorans]